MNRRRFPESHLLLGGMSVDIQGGGIQLQINRCGGMPVPVQHILISLPQRMAQHPVTHRPAIDEEILQVGLGAGGFRQTDPAPQPQPGFLMVDEHAGGDEFPPTQFRNPLRPAGLILSLIPI